MQTPAAASTPPLESAGQPGYVPDPEPARQFRPGEDPNLVEDLRGLAEEASALAKAELAFQKSRAAYAGSQAKKILALCVVAAVFAFFAVTAFIVGLVISLAGLIGPWASMAVVTVGLLLLAFVCLLNAKSRLNATKAVVSDGGENGR
ncbi:phage holin family protein [Novosphingobium sp. YJ-S2-02]|uniref:Phage holin family protein n=1 Tax=Novosphingobium aureum TaxID=2792964 RepID=A0A931HBS3_9SPHN|nr:phage holin family protein [Novosphingobium aureum]